MFIKESKFELSSIYNQLSTELTELLSLDSLLTFVEQSALEQHNKTSSSTDTNQSNNTLASNTVVPSINIDAAPTHNPLPPSKP